MEWGLVKWVGWSRGIPVCDEAWQVTRAWGRTYVFGRGNEGGKRWGVPAAGVDLLSTL